jgi:hypothetical protein
MKKASGGKKKMKTFKEFRTEEDRILPKSYKGATLIEVPPGEEFPPDAEMRIFVWTDADDKKGPQRLVEVKGNATLKLRGQYYYRYDPPRTASTGSEMTPQGDWHLYNGNKEIAAWDDQGKARHGFAPGTKIPNKAWKELQRLHPNAKGLKGQVLEDILKGFGGKSLLLES